MPSLAPGLQLLGRFERSGHRNAPCLVRRSDGQIVQLTPYLHAVLEAIDGSRGYQEIADEVAQVTGKIPSTADIECLVEDKLRPLGLLRQPDGSDPVVKRANPLLGLRFRMVITDQRITRRIAAPFSKLFFTPLMAAVAIGFLVLTGWLMFDRGLAGAVRQSLYEPGLLLLVFGLTVLSAGFHELGHAAACVRGGGKPGAMGAGLYLVWPAFYTDVTDSYRLDRRSRLRVDLGGIYFNAIFALLAFGLWASTGWEAMLAIVPLQALQMVRQLIPLVRLDGYHILADLTGVPDLFAHIKPILAGLLPSNWGRGKAANLKPWVRTVVSAWVLLVVPLFAVSIVLMIVVAPRIVATAWDSVGVQWGEMTSAWTGGEQAAALVDALSILALTVPILSMGYLVSRVVRRIVQKTWTSTAEHPVRRAVAIVVAACLIAALAVAWWPGDKYTPIEAGERGTVAEVAEGVPLVQDLLPASAQMAAPAVPQADVAAPVFSAPALPSLAATPVEAATVLGATATDTDASADDGFRFNLPDAPADGDNQALAVNYTDGTAVFAMALSMILAGDDVVDNANSAYALASCTDCLAAAIAFQLVMILDQADVIVPENAAVAVGAYCVRCVTYALAFQVIVTLDEPLSEKAQRELDAIWSQLEDLQANIANVPLAEIYTRLMEIEAEIIDFFERQGVITPEESEVLNGDDQSHLYGASPSPTPGESPSPEPSPSASTEPSPSPSSEPSPTASPSPSSEPTAEPSPSPTSP